MNPVIVIPARSGSKRLPGKNLLKIGGKSLIQRCVETALATKLGPVWINSDALELRNEGSLAGAHVYIRPEHLAQDDTSTQDVVRDMALGALWEDDKPVILMQCTSPFTAVRDIQDLHFAYRRHAPVALSRCHEAKPCGAGYVFPAILAKRQMLFDPCINWEYYTFSYEENPDIDTQADFDRAAAIALAKGNNL